MKIPFTLIAILFFSTTLAPAAGDTPSPQPDKATYLRLAGELERNLQREILERWFPAAVDEQGGGFHENYGLDWSKRPGTSKSIVYQSRLTWTAAQAARRFPEKADFYLAMTRRGAACLADKMWDKERGGFYWSVDANGQPNLEGAQYKQTYGVAFGLYALAAGYQATGDAVSLELAKKCFQWMEAHAHDNQNKGYYEYVALDGSRASAAGANVVGARGDQKSMNTHIHVLEALTGLYQVWPDPAVKARVEEVYDLCRDKIYGEPGYLTQFLTADWRRIPGPDSFGHDVEAGFLMVEAATALGRPDDERAWTAARRLVDHAMAGGWDNEHGGLYDAGDMDAQGMITGGLKTEKIWWVEAEHLNALLLQHERHGKETNQYWDAFLKQWEFIKKYQVDHEHGGWYPYVEADGKPRSNRAKSDRWTECYHQARAMFVVSEGLRRLAGEKAELAGEKTERNGNWPQFRGPGARGIADGAAFPEHWSATENVAWKTDLPGRGWSSPVVWGGRVFLTTVVSQGAVEAPKKGLYLGGNRLQPSGNIHEWWVYCLDLETGKVRWKDKVHEGKPAAPIHLKNSYASETPVSDGERVYFAFGGVGIFAYDLDGKKIWEERLEPRKMRFGWGTAASPALYEDRLYFVNDNEEKSELLALDKRTGKEIWRVPRDEKSNWATPYVWKNSQRTEVVTPGTGKVRSYDLNGKELWSLQGMSGITIATPFAEGDLLYITSGYVGSPLRPIYAIRPGGSGDISLAKVLPAPSVTSNPFIAWCNWTAAPYNPTTLLYRGILYVLHDRGMLAAYDAKSGKAFFEREKIPDGGAFSASPWAANGKIYCLNEDGVTFVFNAGEKFTAPSVNRLAEDDMGMATPAIAGEKLLIRTSARIYCIAPGR